MKSQVYFIPVEQSDSPQAVGLKLKKLLQASRLLDFVHKDDKVAVKIHFGEEANTGYVKPEFARIVCDELKERDAWPFLSDTNTLYKGKRTNSGEHLDLAHQHGFTPKNVGAPVIIPDDTQKKNVKDIRINAKFIKTAKIAKVYSQANALVGIAHFKGHIMTGFGGALKNIGMGCASRKGKLEQHSDIAPLVIKTKCTGCGDCVLVCPAEAITLKKDKAYIDNAKCIGCASCIAACKYTAIDVDWESGGELLQEKMIEYVQAVLSRKKGKAVFINFCLKITKECDCIAKDDPRIVPDIGILASLDPVSIDKASFDLVRQAAGKDIFKEAHPERDGLKQLDYAHKLGLGSLDYELVACPLK